MKGKRIAVLQKVKRTHFFARPKKFLASIGGSGAYPGIRNQREGT